MKRTPFYRRPGRTGQFSGLLERVIWMIQTRGRPVTGSEIAKKFGVTLIEFNRVANGITRGSGQIAQIVESEKWINEDGICDRTFDLVTKPKVVTPQGKSRLFSSCRPPSPPDCSGPLHRRNGVHPMTHAHDDIRVGIVCLPFIGNGLLMPWGEVVSNPLKAQRLAEEYRERQEAA